MSLLTRILNENFEALFVVYEASEAPAVDIHLRLGPLCREPRSRRGLRELTEVDPAVLTVPYR